MEFDGKDEPATRSGEEVVFVLRLRPRNAGWRGQVKRLDTGSSRYVASNQELYLLLDSAWQLAQGEKDCSGLSPPYARDEAP
jgi:hypothetical protein